MLFRIWLHLYLPYVASILLLPLFNRLVERTLDFSTILNPIMLGIMLLLYLIISILISGIYPAVVLSGLKLIKILKKQVFLLRGTTFDSQEGR